MVEQGSFDEPEELDTVKFSRRKKIVKWSIYSDT